ncbi:MAG: DNA cytosine methyltransferase [Candidatus Delongbacteria bacterium]
MQNAESSFVGVDLFAGAGGMSLGAQMAGVYVALAIECDKHTAATYSFNHPDTTLVVDNIKNVNTINVSQKDKVSILFGGPPCQGFSTSNQRTRNRKNPTNWLFEEFIRIVHLWKPDWIVFENVKGIVETENGLFLNSVIGNLLTAGYSCNNGVLCASDFGVPQIRSRFFIIASRNGFKLEMPKATSRHPVTVRQALADLPILSNGASKCTSKYARVARSKYAREMRDDKTECTGNLVTKSADYIIERYKQIPQGGNWKNISEDLMANYTDRTRCHTGIYRRLSADKPSVVLGNYRKNMVVHPWENRGLSVREAARLQSFPDWYEFRGSIGFQQQQVGNAVPPLLAKSVFEAIVKFSASNNQKSMLNNK